MQNRKSLLVVILSLFCIVMLMACGKTQETEMENVVYKFGGQTVTYGEFYIYAKTVEEEYQRTYGNGIWSLELAVDDSQSTVKEVTIRDLIADINRVKVLSAKAGEMNISLGDNERAEAENTGAAFYQGLTEAELSETEITRDLVVQVLEENMLAQKVYNQMISEYDFEISDEEARMTTFYDMVFECYSVKQDGTVEEYTDEKKATQLQKANEALSSLAQKENVTYDTIVNKYNLEYAASYTMSRTELIQAYGESITNQIMALSDGEVSTVIESEYGYHIFKMMQSKDEELTKKNKEQIIAQKQKEYFNGVYEEWLKTYDSHFSMKQDVNMELVNRFPFSVDADQ